MPHCEGMDTYLGIDHSSCFQSNRLSKSRINTDCFDLEFSHYSSQTLVPTFFVVGLSHVKCCIIRLPPSRC